jgi:hypothetical protein
MKLAKSLLLGTTAALAAVAGAQAADLPSMKAAPVEYVRVCSTYGEGFFYVPGTDSCLRISGRIRVDIGYVEPLSRVDDAFGFRARGRVNVDHRTATAYGLLRTYIRYEIDRNSGTFFGATGAVVNSPNLAQGFIQFGGLTAGRVTSFFSNPDLPTTHFGTLRFDDAPDVNVLAYTYSFGNGFSATIAAEDPLSRRVQSTVIGNFPFSTSVGFLDGDDDLFTAGTRMPDIVGNVRYAGSWGSVQLSGAVHQIRDVGFQFDPFFPVNPFAPAIADTDYGFAVGVQAGINLPFLGAGDAAWIAATYTDGAFAYINGGQDSPSYDSIIGAGRLGLSVADAFINGLTGDMKTTKAWSIAGGLTHNWTPTFQSSLFGSYAQVDVPGAATGFNLATGTSSGLVDFKEYRIGANTIWMPVAGLQLGVEVLYTKVDPKGRVLVSATDAAGNFLENRTTGGEDIWEGRLRIQRDF